MDEINMEKPVSVWAWNGYNSQEVVSGLTRREIIRRMLKARRDKDFYLAEIIEDSENDVFSVLVTFGYEFYGWREQRVIYTTRNGAEVPEPGNSLEGTWYPAKLNHLSFLMKRVAGVLPPSKVRR